MSEQYEWNGLRVRRDERGKWMCLSNYDKGVWLPLAADTIHTAVAAELDKLYPLPRTVTLGKFTFTWESDQEGHYWYNSEWVGVAHRGTDPLGKALDRIWELENGNDR